MFTDYGSNDSIGMFSKDLIDPALGVVGDTNRLVSPIYTSNASIKTTVDFLCVRGGFLSFNMSPRDDIKAALFMRACLELP